MNEYAEEDDGPGWEQQEENEKERWTAERIIKEMNAKVREGQRVTNALCDEWVEFDREFRERQELIQRLGAAVWR